ncbi:DUF3426 domain-containing protein [Hahella aquimaris]|uniref:DUF3426 domain-containing protein n=1 Tax=Hahella sp. HNIBRBA332 TaxID=3015983 RepID=UPI00273C6649|nr:DUF3426 domain-containing protein [Hahella sp. HNIBRBA332]WLQ13987.1 DUF3426 domain-containing protein [Hahella sp. HNIBRBA332]
MLTRCPHCAASFRVTDKQLQAAHGKVRCGACMKVFNAAEHLMSDSAPAHVDPTPVKAPPPRPATVSSAPKPATKPKVERGIKESAAKASSSVITPLTAMDPDDDLGDLTDALVAAGDDDDEFIFQDNPEEDKHDEGYSGGMFDQSELSDSFRELDRGGSSAKREFETPEETEEEETTDESWAEQMLRELERPGQAPPPPPVQEAKQDVKKAAPKEALKVDPPPPPKPEPAPVPAAPEPEPEYESYPEFETPMHAEPPSQFHGLRAEPISIDHSYEQKASPGVLSKIMWTFANLLLVVFLVSQLAWFHFDKLARYDQLRPWYAKACEVIGCTLPSLYDVGQIRSQNLVVRSHPLVNKALIIDAIITNQASFAQPFPNISLNFSDINNNVIAHRIFTPLEYLSGEAKDMTQMPPSAPVHITLEILDPGKQAVNYTLDFISALSGPAPSQ